MGPLWTDQSLGTITVVDLRTTTIDIPSGQLRPDDWANLPPDVRDEVEALMRRGKPR